MLQRGKGCGLIGDLSVLAVEDHESEGGTIVELVRRLNPKKVYSAADAQKALEILASSAVDVIVSDIDMPKMDGLEFMRRLAETASRSSVIIVSAIPPALLTATEEMIRAYRINLLGIVQKPVTQDALEALL